LGHALTKSRRIGSAPSTSLTPAWKVIRRIVVRPDQVFQRDVSRNFSSSERRSFERTVAHYVLISAAIVAILAILGVLGVILLPVWV
jgi:hypothetical protein